MAFPDLEGCEAQGPDLEDAIDNAADAAYNWICAEMEEEECELPPQTHEDDIELKEGGIREKDSGENQAASRQ